MRFLVVALAALPPVQPQEKYNLGVAQPPPDPHQEMEIEMGVDVSEQPDKVDTDSPAPASKKRDRNAAVPAETQATELPPVGRIAQLRHEVQVGLRELQWREVLMFGVLSGALMSL